ncbi:hypothetical protein QBC40DRAFT_181642 [Triangularia verruculosa]|uniref:DUF1168-domain-containing protein n=1 Tax=Triangularia verruculosa TaxID=2587418 RepID=A0AAN7ASR6_9PEZI|nr:hypothetical protein QBC40DRAFT_181642 [Triangularia verruculosa]
MSNPPPSKRLKTTPSTSLPPKKKHNLSPTSLQAATLTSLFANPDKPIPLPPLGGPLKKPLPPPPEIVTNVQGSSAGAGSGEFHVYKAARRREYERLRQMEEETAAEKAQREFEEERLERKRKDEEKTRKNREKRNKKKMNKGKGGSKSVTPQPTTATTNGKDGGEDKGTDGKEEDSRGDKEGNGTTAPEPPAVPVAEGVGLVICDDD